MGLVHVPKARAAELAEALAARPVQSFFPGATRAGPAEGTPPASAVYIGENPAGYVFLTSDVVASAGYSGKPVKILAGVSLGGKITGATVYQHKEPILVLGIREKRLHDFIAQFTGMDIRRKVRLGRSRRDSETGIDMVSGASITSLVFSDSIMRAARMVARSRGIIEPAGGDAGGRVDMETFHEASWRDLLAGRSIRNLRLTGKDVAKTGASGGGIDAEGTFIDLYTGLATPAAIGQNLLGFTVYNSLISKLSPGEQVIFVGGGGLYSFRGYTWRKSGVFDRLQLAQGNKTVRLTRAMHKRVEKLRIKGAPELREVSLFLIPPASGFDAARPWRLEVLVEGKTESGEARFHGFPLRYQLPAAYLTGGGPGSGLAQGEEDEPLWAVRWRDSVVHVAILCIGLGALMMILIFQDQVARRHEVMDRIRLGFLVFTLVYLGWIATAQLSVINVLTFINALLSGFRWDFFLLEPLIFILWGFVAIALLFWGRGVFCGWLCPFGALQEILNRIAVHFKIPQVSVPFVVNERLWPLKYIAFLSLIALSLGPADMAGQLAELEPFKTAIALKFIRAWPFVAYALLILVAALFINRAFCRYLCPLGAALGIPGKNRMFDWLKRRHQCGVECHICATQCPVQAIHPDGHINPHECIYCLECQSIYFNDHKCPPLIDRRKRREQRAMMREQRLKNRAQAETQETAT